MVVVREVVPVKANGKVQQGEQSEGSGDEDCGLERVAARVGFGQVAKFGEETGVEKEEENREIPEDGKKIEPVTGAGIRDGLLVFLWRELVGGGGILSGSGGGWSGGILSGGGLQSDRIAAGSGSEE